MSETRPPARRFDLLSRSASGLSYVREKRGGITRVLTPSELEDFNDPPPCPECAEQFGCEHFNCAGEPMLSESEIETGVPPNWLGFAREFGLSRNDLERLRVIELHEDRYQPAAGVHADLRTNELVILLNEWR